MEESRFSFLGEYGKIEGEAFSRRALIFLEQEFRKMCLVLLGELTLNNICLKPVYAEIAGLQHPAWGSWNGFLLGVLKARRGILSSGTSEERERILKAAELSWLSGSLEEFVEIEDSELFKRLEQVTGYTPGKNARGLRTRELLAIPIQLRNRTAHDNIIDRGWWENTAYILNYIADLYTDSTIYKRFEHNEGTEPWMIKDEDLWCYNGIETKGENSFVVYVSMSGKGKLEKEMAGPVMNAFMKILGDEELQEMNFKRLMKKLAPDEVKGFLMGDYLVGEKAGEGGYAEVYRGIQLSTGRKAAIKILKYGFSEIDRDRFLREADYLARFDHPNIIKVYEHNELPWRSSYLYDLSKEDWFREFKKNHGDILTFIAIEWIDGWTLDDIFHEMRDGKKTCSEREISGWFLSCAEALSVIHQTNLIHRDISPRNIMLTEAGVIKLMDFGISRSLTTDRTIMTSSGKVLGTEAYMSPEQLDYERAKSELGPLSDLYSLGATFYELFTISRIYNHDKDEKSVSMATELKRKGEKPKEPITINGRLSNEISIILMGCLENQPGDRYKGAVKLKEDLECFLSDRAISYKRPNLKRRMRLFYRRNRRIVNLTAAFILIVIISSTAYLVSVVTERNRAVTAEAINSKSLSRIYYKQAQQELDNNNSRTAVGYLTASLGSSEDPAASSKLAFMLQSERWPVLKEALPTGPMSAAGGYTVSSNGGALVLTSFSGDKKAELKGSDGNGKVIVSEDGKLIAQVSGGMETGIKIWSSKGLKIKGLKLKTDGTEAGFSRDGKWFYASIEKGKYCIVPVNGGEARYFTGSKQKSTVYQEVLPGNIESQIFIYNDGNYIAWLYGGNLDIYRFDGMNYSFASEADLAKIFDYRSEESKKLSSLLPELGKSSGSGAFLMNLKLYMDESMKKLIVTNSGSFAVLDPVSSKLLYKDTDLKYIISDIDFSHGSGVMAVARYAPYISGISYGGGNICLYDLRNLKRIPEKFSQLDLSAASAGFSPDDSMLLAVDKARGVYVFDMKNGDQVCQPVSVQGAPVSAVFQDENHMIVDTIIADSGGNILNTAFKRLKYYLGGKFEPKIAEETQYTNLMESTYKGRLVIGAGSKGSFVIDPSSGKSINYYELQTEGIMRLTSMDQNEGMGSVLLTYADASTLMSNDGTLLLLGNNGSKELNHLDSSGHFPDKGELSPKGDKFFIIYNNSLLDTYIQIFDYSGKKIEACSEKVTAYGEGGKAFEDAGWISQEEGILAVNNHSIFVIDSKGNIKQNISPAEFKNSFIKKIVISTDGKYVAVGSGALMTSDGVTAEGVYVYRVADLVKGKSESIDKIILRSTPSKLVLSPDERKIGVACLDGSMEVCDFPNVSQNSCNLKNSGKINDFKFDNSGSFIIAGIDSSGPRTQTVNELDNDTGLVSQSFMSYGCKYAVWNLEEQTLVYESPRLEGENPAVAVTGDNQAMIGAGTNIYRLWLPSGKTPLWVLSFSEALSGYKINDNAALERVYYGPQELKKLMGTAGADDGWTKLAKAVIDEK